MNASFTDVRGETALLAKIVDCWASLYGKRSVAYRASRGMRSEPAIPVVVQRVVNSEQAGVAFTADPDDR
jgi:pyruvate,water dikinase